MYLICCPLPSNLIYLTNDAMQSTKVITQPVIILSSVCCGKREHIIKHDEIKTFHGTDSLEMAAFHWQENIASSQSSCFLSNLETRKHVLFYSIILTTSVPRHDVRPIDNRCHACSESVKTPDAPSNTVQICLCSVFNIYQSADLVKQLLLLHLPTVCCSAEWSEETLPYPVRARWQLGGSGHMQEKQLQVGGHICGEIVPNRKAEL